MVQETNISPRCYPSSIAVQLAFDLMSPCSVCGRETDLHVNGVAFCPDCETAVIGNKSRSLEEVSRALEVARREYYDALAGHRGDPDDTEAKANARLDTASLAYAKALRDYRALFHRGQPHVARVSGLSAARPACA